MSQLAPVPSKSIENLFNNRTHLSCYHGQVTDNARFGLQVHRRQLTRARSELGSRRARILICFAALGTWPGHRYPKQICDLTAQTEAKSKAP
jgi:hypothetical protein